MRDTGPWAQNGDGAGLVSTGWVFAKVGTIPGPGIATGGREIAGG